MLADVIERQQIETKNTVSFLRFVLGKRAPKDQGMSMTVSNEMMYPTNRESETQTFPSYSVQNSAAET